MLECKINSEKIERPVDSCTLVIFGATGDLTMRKLIPSIFKLFQSKMFPENFAIVGISNVSMSIEKFQSLVIDSIKNAAETKLEDQTLLNEFSKHLYYTNGPFENEETFVSLNHYIEKIEAEKKLSKKRIYYLAVPPKIFSSIVIMLGKTGMSVENDGCFRRIVLEKPLGHDLESSRDLAHDLKKYFKESQIYRIDHYLGKETVENIIIFRFANGIYEPIWNRRYIDSVQITVSEVIGVENRGSYYDDIGALRDMVPSHLFQVLALIAMEPPSSLESESFRDEYKKVLNSVVPFAPDDVLKNTVRGQYDRGEIEDQLVSAYTDEPKIAKKSTTETYAALKLTIDNWRWSGVPFYLRTGKRLKKLGTEVVIQFKEAPVKLFCESPLGVIGRNQIVLHIHPNDGISIQFEAKVPGPLMKIKNVNLEFKYQDYFKAESSIGYETLLYECLKGEQTLFRREDQVDLAWQILMPILDVWKANPPKDFPNYSAGSYGPKEADNLLERDGRRWKEI
jgi:glucose-6-phosphate 1-dehydrogenase